MIIITEDGGNDRMWRGTMWSSKIRAQIDCVEAYLGALDYFDFSDVIASDASDLLRAMIAELWRWPAETTKREALIACEQVLQESRL